jgi:hypothetical protein
MAAKRSWSDVLALVTETVRTEDTLKNIVPNSFCFVGDSSETTPTQPAHPIITNPHLAIEATHPLAHALASLAARWSAHTYCSAQKCARLLSPTLWKQSDQGG